MQLQASISSREEEPGNFPSLPEAAKQQAHTLVLQKLRPKLHKLLTSADALPAALAFVQHHAQLSGTTEMVQEPAGAVQVCTKLCSAWQVRNRVCMSVRCRAGVLCRC